jgi:hypothetical protein
MKKWSRSPVSQNKAMNDLPARLALLAAQGKTITYGALAADLGCRIADLTAALERLMEEDAALGRPLRAALLEGRLNNGQPARGFFEKAASLGIVPDDPATFVQDTRRALYAQPLR